MEYRREIDGLRAVAVVPVILFHANISGFSGGFVGVDVFFVISGYLITSLISAELTKGSFSIVSFYERRARRILPALFAVVLFCIPFAHAWMDPEEYRDFARSAGAVVLFISNVYFWQQGDYFSPSSDERPLLHTWSLGVEEQFYVVFPLFMMLIWGFGRRVLFWTVGALLVAGLATAEMTVRSYPDAAFYLPHTRVWELGIGVMCALLRPRLAGRDNGAAAALGLALIALAVILYDRDTPFPSLYALAPTVGTGLAVLFAGQSNWTGRVLSLPPLVGMGLLSYSAYLIHQPLLAFARIRAFDQGAELVLLIAASIVLAYVSWRFVEKPFRGAEPVLGRQSLFATAGVGIVAIAAYGAVHLYAASGDATFAETAGEVEIFGTSTFPDDCVNLKGEINQHYRHCTFESPPHRQKIAIFGDSHADAILPAFLRLAKRDGDDVTVQFLGGCPPLIGSFVHRGNFALGVCPRVVERQMEILDGERFDAVFLVARWSLYDGTGKRYRVSGNRSGTSATSEQYRADLQRLFAETVAEYRRRGVRLFIVRQVPQQQVSSKTLYRRILHRDYSAEEADALLRRVSSSRQKHLDRQAMINAIIDESGIDPEDVIDLADAFCDAQTCLIGTPRIGYYLDEDHISPKGAALTETALSDALRRISSPLVTAQP